MPEVDPIGGTPGPQIITTGLYRSGKKVIPAGVKSHIYGTSGTGDDRMCKILYQNAYHWIPVDMTRSALEPVAPVADEEEGQGDREAEAEREQARRDALKGEGEKEKAPIKKVKGFRVGDTVKCDGESCVIVAFPTRNSAVLDSVNKESGKFSAAKVSIADLSK